jgi:hypothetical protein
LRVLNQKAFAQAKAFLFGCGFTRIFADQNEENQCKNQAGIGFAEQLKKIGPLRAGASLDFSNP